MCARAKINLFEMMKTTKKKVEDEDGFCRQCVHARYMRSADVNPVVVLCQLGFGRYGLRDRHKCPYRLLTTLPKLIYPMVHARSLEEQTLIREHRSMFNV